MHFHSNEPDSLKKNHHNSRTPDSKRRKSINQFELTKVSKFQTNDLLTTRKSKNQFKSMSSHKKRPAANSSFHQNNPKKQFEQELVIGLQIHKDEIINTQNNGNSNEFKDLYLSSLHRVQQVTKHVMRESLVKQELIPSGTDFKNDVSIKLQIFYSQIGNYKVIDDQKDFQIALKQFKDLHKKGITGLDSQYFQVEARIHSSRFVTDQQSQRSFFVHNKSKIGGEPSLCGYQKRYRADDRSSTSFDDKFFAQLNTEKDKKYKNVLEIESHSSISISQTTDEDQTQDYEPSTPKQMSQVVLDGELAQSMSNVQVSSFLIKADDTQSMINVLEGSNSKAFSQDTRSSKKYVCQHYAISKVKSGNPYVRKEPQQIEGSRGNGKSLSARNINLNKSGEQRSPRFSDDSMDDCLVLVPQDFPIFEIMNLEKFCKLTTLDTEPNKLAQDSDKREMVIIHSLKQEDKKSNDLDAQIKFKELDQYRPNQQNDSNNSSNQIGKTSSKSNSFSQGPEHGKSLQSEQYKDSIQSNSQNNNDIDLQPVTIPIHNLSLPQEQQIASSNASCASQKSSNARSGNIPASPASQVQAERASSETFPSNFNANYHYPDMIGDMDDLNSQIYIVPVQNMNEARISESKSENDENMSFQEKEDRNSDQIDTNQFYSCPGSRANSNQQVQITNGDSEYNYGQTSKRSLHTIHERPSELKNTYMSTLGYSRKDGYVQGTPPKIDYIGKSPLLKVSGQSTLMDLPDVREVPSDVEKDPSFKNTSSNGSLFKLPSDKSNDKNRAYLQETKQTKDRISEANDNKKKKKKGSKKVKQNQGSCKQCSGASRPSSPEQNASSAPIHRSSTQKFDDYRDDGQPLRKRKSEDSQSKEGKCNIF